MGHLLSAGSYGLAWVPASLEDLDMSDSMIVGAMGLWRSPSPAQVLGDWILCRRIP